MGGNAASGDFIVFLDAHCRVSPRWLETPYDLLVEVDFFSLSKSESSNHRELCRLHSRRELQREASWCWNWQVFSLF